MTPNAASGTNRFLVLDTLRGLMLVLLAFDHYGGAIRNLTYEPLGFVSAAEGFIFLAGLMLGLLYVKKMAVTPQLVTEKLLGRTFKIYLTYVALSLIFLVTVMVSPWYANVWQDLLPLGFRPDLTTVVRTLFVVHQTDYLGILPLYVLLFLAAPLLLRLFARGHARAVLIVSTLLYLVQPLGPDALLDTLFVDTLYNAFTWNVLFVFGIFFGYRYREGTLRLSYRPRYLVSALTVAATLFVLRELMRFGALGDYGYWLKLAFTREYLSPLRLFNVALLAYLLFGLAQIRPQWLQNRWLSFLGQHSLYVFAWHGLVLYFVWPYMGNFNRELESILFVAALTIPAWLHQTWRRQHLRRAARVNLSH